MTFDEFVARFERVSPAGDGVLTKCPAHEDNRESLSIKAGEKGVVLHCHAKCKPEAVVAAMGLEMKDLFYDSRPKRSGKKGTFNVVREYSYLDEKKKLLFQVCRLDPKDFRPRRPDGNGGWIYNLKNVRNVPYRLPEVLAAAKARSVIFVCEGEKDVDALVAAGAEATCNHGGAGKWKRAFGACFRGSPRAIVIADKDDPGRKHAWDVAGSLSGVVPRVDVIEVPRGKDAADFLAAGGTVEDLLRLADDGLRAAASGQSCPEASTDEDDQAEEKHGDEEAGGKKRGPTHAEILVDLAGCSGVDLFHDADKRPFATVTVNGHRETWRVRSQAFKTWLSGVFYRAEKGKVPGSQALADALSLLEGRAVHDGEQRPVFVRLGRVEDVVYLDLGDPDWKVVKVTRDGWQVVPAIEVPVRFRRPAGLRPLPVPTRGGRLEDLRDLLNVPEEKWPLLAAWLVGSLRGRGPFFVLALSGEQGSGKSTAASMLRRLIDPAMPERRTVPRDERDLAITASNALVVSYDNLSSIPEWLADGLCRISTGGGFATRALYTDDEEQLFDVTRPVLVNGIPDLLGRPDLADRALAVHLPAIPEERRRTERELWETFQATHPRVLGALLDAVVAALAGERDVVLERAPRMADAATWVVAAEGALGLPAGAFVEALADVREDAVAQGLEADPLGQLVLGFVEEESWEGPSGQLLDRLNELATDETRRARGWPRNGSMLTNALVRLAPLLRQVGVEFLGPIKGGKGRRRCILRSVGGAAGGAPRATRSEARHPVTAGAASLGGLGGAGGGVLPFLSGPEDHEGGWTEEVDADDH